MDARELAAKFADRVAAAVVEKDKQEQIADENVIKRTADIEHCKRQLADEVLPFFAELSEHMKGQFSFSHQIDIHDHKPVGVSFQVGDGGPVTITTVFGNIIVARLGSSGASKGMAFVYPPDAEPYISNSGDLTREKMSQLIEMVIDNTGR